MLHTIKAKMFRQLEMSPLDWKCVFVEWQTCEASNILNENGILTPHCSVSPNFRKSFDKIVPHHLFARLCLVKMCSRDRLFLSFCHSQFNFRSLRAHGFRRVVGSVSQATVAPKKYFHFSFKSHTTTTKNRTEIDTFVGSDKTID